METDRLPPEISCIEKMGKDIKFPIRRKCSLRKLAEIYDKSFDEFMQIFPDDTPLQYMFDLHDLFFNAQYLRTDKSGRLEWVI